MQNLAIKNICHWALAVMLAVCVIVPALAVTPDEILSNPKLEERARALSSELRCMVCQNQSIDDSAAPLAKDLRVLVRERLLKGDSDREILNFLVERYGDFILLKPPMKMDTLVLWVSPFLILLFGGLALFIKGRRNGERYLAVETLTGDEREKIDAILNSKKADR